VAGRAWGWLAPAVGVVLLALVPLPPPEPPTYPTPSASPLPAITVLAVGDSLTYGADGSVTASYRAELSRLMMLTGQTHQWRVEAAPGSKCSYWAARVDALITTHHPDVIFLDCGTNDTPTDNTEADYRAILATAAARGVQVVASLIGIPDMRANAYRPYILDWMHGTNLAIRRALASYPQVPVADFQRVPANPEWLQSDGIHLTARSEAAYGQIFYQAAQPMRGWKTLAQMRTYEMCGLSGAWRDDPWPTPDVAYRVCRT
jgi:lysophospholipase L1-like esterase